MDAMSTALVRSLNTIKIPKSLRIFFSCISGLPPSNMQSLWDCKLLKRISVLDLKCYLLEGKFLVQRIGTSQKYQALCVFISSY